MRISATQEGPFLRALLITALALLLTAVSLGATSQDSVDTYLPGAIVTLAVQIDAPAEWALNPDVPLRIKIDPSAIKLHDLKVDKPVIDFKTPGHDASFTAQVPVKISAKQAAGDLSIPLAIECGICTTDQSRCTFVDQSVDVSLKIAGKGGPGGAVVPAKKGRYLSHCALIPPD
jgi:hypothetical protein